MPSWSSAAFGLLFATTSSCSCDAFAFQLPQIRLPWDAESGSSSPSPSSRFGKVQPKSPILPNDKVVIFGGTGGVGQLVTRKLRSRQGKAYNVCVLARSEAKARELLDDADSNTSNNDIEGGLNVVELNLVGDDKAGDEQLCEAIKGELAIRYCVEGGVKTSTRDENDSGGGSRRGYVDTLSNATGIVISVGTTAFPTKRWAGGNTPQAIDQEAVSRIANLAASNCPSLRRMVLLTSVG
eukprot:scaffold9076_cov192-Alexandrium_tamarense.AAC.5